MTAPTPKAGNGRSAKTVLIIDDDAHMVAIMALGLESQGYHAITAANAANGLELAAAHMPDLILCDVDMPVKDGRALLKELRADPKLADRQFVLMTGRPTIANPRAGMDLGADDFLLKPFDLAALLRCVEARLSRAELSRRIDDGAVERLRKNLNTALPHEFFTPLASILGLTELLQKELDTAGKDEIRDFLREIHEAGRRLHRRLSNYLLILGLGPKAVERETATLDAEMVSGMVRGGAAAAAKRHNREADLDVDVAGATVRSSPADVSVLAEELVDNAFAYSRPGTPVRVRARADSGAYRITVADLGRGMTPRQLQMLDPDVRKDPTPYGPQGAGLGLTLVYKLVHHLGGEIRVESESGKGTTAYVSLPIRTP